MMRRSALEPVISGEIMELHHAKHHQAYVNGFNTAYEKYKEVRSALPASTVPCRHVMHAHAEGARQALFLLGAVWLLPEQGLRRAP